MQNTVDYAYRNLLDYPVSRLRAVLLRRFGWGRKILTFEGLESRIRVLQK
jgi:hypothetical protein